jgi:hypothetical protein
MGYSQVPQPQPHDAGVSVERVQTYLKTDEQDRDLFRAVEYITGCCPIGKHS